jgi:hypothetical protein
MPMQKKDPLRRSLLRHRVAPIARIGAAQR